MSNYVDTIEKAEKLNEELEKLLLFVPKYEIQHPFGEFEEKKT